LTNQQTDKDPAAAAHRPASSMSGSWTPRFPTQAGKKVIPKSNTNVQILLRPRKRKTSRKIGESQGRISFIFYFPQVEGILQRSFSEGKNPS